jgi:hypothetical protein
MQGPTTVPGPTTPVHRSRSIFAGILAMTTIVDISPIFAGVTGEIVYICWVRHNPTLANVFRHFAI